MQTIIYVKRKEEPRTSQKTGTWFQWVQTDKGKLTVFKQEEADKLQEGGYYDVDFKPNEDGRGGGIITGVLGVAQDAPPQQQELPGTSVAAPSAQPVTAKPATSDWVSQTEKEYHIARESVLNRATDLLQARIQMDPEYRKTDNTKLAKDALEIANLLMPFIMAPIPGVAVPALVSSAPVPLSEIPGLKKASEIAQPTPAPAPAATVPPAPAVKQDGVFQSSATAALLKNRIKKISVKTPEAAAPAEDPNLPAFEPDPPEGVYPV